LVYFTNLWKMLGTTIKILLRVKEQRNILHEISKRKANWIGHILRRNCCNEGLFKPKI
jgi:hypothetical protein